MDQYIIIYEKRQRFIPGDTCQYENIMQLTRFFFIFIELKGKCI